MRRLGALTNLSTVLLVGHREDEHSDVLENLLSRRRKVQVARLALDALPQSDFAWEPGSRLRIGSQELKGPFSGLWRRPGSPAPAGIDSRHSHFAESECRDAFHGALRALPVAWITRPDDLIGAEFKLVQLETARRLGIDIPQTVVTNSPRVGISFAKKAGELVAKPVRYGLVSESPPRVAWTMRIAHRDLAGLRGPPVVIQERIEASRHLRIVTVRSRVFLAHLETDALDWRRDLENHERFVGGEPEQFITATEGALAIAEALRVGFTAQDWIVTASGRQVFLEANPNGQWLFVDRVVGGAIADELVRQLEFLASCGDAERMATPLGVPNE